MRLLWSLVKIAIALVLVIPICIIVLATALGLFGAVLGLAILTLRLAVIGLMIYGGFRLLSWMFRDRTPAPRPRELKDVPRPDPHYEAAMRELDRELGEAR
jgi:hypothetical protein